MKKLMAMQIMSALSQPTRFDVYNRLIAVLPGGMAAGALAEATGTAPTAMSPHLAILSRAGLLRSTKIGRNIIYKANAKPLDELVELLVSVRDAGSAAKAG